MSRSNSLSDLQQKFDARRGDTAALDVLGAAVTRAVIEYKRKPTARNHRRIARATQALLAATPGAQRRRRLNGDIWGAP